MSGLETQTKEYSFLALKGLSLLLFYQVELRIKRGGQIRFGFIDTNINMSISGKVGV